MRFYTYAQYRADDPNQGPFYIGKGQGRRAWKTVGKGRGKYWRHVAEKHGVRVEIMARWDTEDEAYQHEVFLIETLRMLDTRIVNLNDGGDGARNLSSEVRAKISARAKEQWSDPIQRAALLAARSTPEALAKKSAALKAAFSRNKERRSAILKAAKNTPEAIARRKELHADPEYRARMSSAVRAARARPEVQAKHAAALAIRFPKAG